MTQTKDPLGLDPAEILEQLKKQNAPQWDYAQNNEIYWIQGWGENFFDINEKGHITVRPEIGKEPLDLYEMVQTLVQRGIEAPILFRFDGIIRSRIQRLYSAFKAAMEEFNYTGSYQLAFPIKVNQQRHVVEVIRNGGKELGLGLEVGSKPELLAVLGIQHADDGLLICNGYKDEEYIELALLARKIGRRPIIIIEQYYEIKMVLEIAQRLQIEPEIGFRMKSSHKGSGRWATSGGEDAKFGLNVHEILMGIDQLQKNNKTHCVKLLHYHIGSQITAIGSIKKTLREASRMYTEIAKLCPTLCFFDVGGGLGVDYDGSKTSSNCSTNYTMEEYARDVVASIQSACNEDHIASPTILSESGRAIVAHHSVLITEVIDVAPTIDPSSQLDPPTSDHEILHELYHLHHSVTKRNCLEVLHDAFDMRESALERFNQGDMNLLERAYADKAYRHLLAKIHAISKTLHFVPEDIQRLNEKLVDMYFCNFSIFQSLPDAWAIQQIFPVMPIHRLNEEPTRRATIVDVTCDSDGKIDRFVSHQELAPYLYLHDFTPSPYYLGIFLVGAYQEILGALHNLFGDTNAVHVDLDSEGNWVFKHMIEGNSVNEVLSYVQYHEDDLLENFRLSNEKALKAGKISNEESGKLKKRFKDALESYTYLVVYAENKQS
jgi:arginine decarboxylase